MTDPAIETRGLRKVYGSTVALDALDIRVEAGEVFGFLGPNGAGKTTAVKLLLGLTRPTGGGGTVLGRPLGDRDARRRIGYLPELFRYQAWLTAREVLDLHASLAGLPSVRRRPEVDRVLALVGLAGRDRDRTGGFSKGMQQRLGLAAALLGDPALVILDEPTSALDPWAATTSARSSATPATAGRRCSSTRTSWARSSGCATASRSSTRDASSPPARSRELLGEQAVRLRVTDLPAEAVAALAAFGSVTDGRRGLAGDPARGPRAHPRPRGARWWLPAAGCTRWIPARRSLEALFLDLVRDGDTAPADERARRMSPRLVLVIAGLTLREIARRRILWVLLGLSVASVVLVGWGVDRLVALAREEGVEELEIRIGVSQVLILIAFMFSFVLAMSAAFLAAPAIASDVETGTVHAMLARPLRRAELVRGPLAGAVDRRRRRMRSPRACWRSAPWGSSAGTCRRHRWSPSASSRSSRSRSSRWPWRWARGCRPSPRAPITVVLFGLGWFAGVLGSIAVAFDAAPLAGLGDVVRVLIPTDGLWRGVIYGLEPPGRAAAVRRAATPRRCGRTRSSPTHPRRSRSRRGRSPGSRWCC